ncbi:MAG: phosphate ABC transporter substrate-binding protein [Desulfovibrio sp.]|uniref:phosphate ABC transporter substrate-binding protein n=1 Tax=Desulfovibrio sp. 7SRBS1 TaxID=3378064 RepID=UPI003B426004
MKKLLVLACLLVIGLTGNAFAGSKIEIKGSTTVFPIMQKAIEAYMAKHPDVSISLSGGGSSNGIKALLDNTTDIAMASRDMKGKEHDLAKKKGIDPVRLVVARDAVAAIVNPANPVKALSSAQLKDIYAGKITNWKEVGGNPGRIAVISRDSSSGTFETWQHLIMQKKTKVTPMALMQASSGAVLQTVGKNKYAISYDGLGYVDNTVKALIVDGVAPTATTAKDGSYPVSRSLFVFTNGAPKGEVKSLLDFLMGPEGQKLVAEAGFVPVK